MCRTIWLTLSILLLSCKYSRLATMSLPEKHLYRAGNGPENPAIQILIFKNDPLMDGAGYGYNIYLDNSLYIHQPNIPVVPGKAGFSTSAKAGLAANLVSYKIQQHLMPPSLSSRELDNLGLLP